MFVKVLQFALFLLLLSQSQCQDTDEKTPPERNKNFGLKYIFIFGSMILVAIIRHISRVWETSIPYSVFSLALGILWGVVSNYNEWMMTAAKVTTDTLTRFDVIYMPIFIFTISFCLDVHAFMKSIWQILIISFPAALLSASITGLLMRQVVEINWEAGDAILFGVISTLSIFPMDVLRWLRETSIHTKYVTILLEGETLFSAAVAITVYNLMVANFKGYVIYWYQFAMCILRMAAFSIPAGYIFGHSGAFFMKMAYNSMSQLMLLTFSMCYLSYYLGEYVSNAGVISALMTGIMMGRERPSLSKEIDEGLVNFWKMICMTFNSVIFIYIGVSAPYELGDQSINHGEYIYVLVTYLMCNMCRFLSFFLFSFILSRIGYGMSFQNMLLCVWGGLKSPLGLSLALEVREVYESDRTKDLFFLHTLAVYLLMLLINASFMPILFKTIGLSEISTSRQVNMNNCMKYIYEARARTVAILKMDRFLSDANWPLVMNSTALKHPYKKMIITADTEPDYEEDEEEEEEDYFMGYKFTFCPDCHKNIPNEPSPKEMREMTKEAKLRLLKLKKTAYSRQFENGMISKEGVRTLHQAVEIAMDSEELVIQLDGLFKLFNKEVYIFKVTRNRLQAVIGTIEEDFKIPRNKLRYWFYRVVHHIGFTVFINTMVLLHMFLITYEFQLTHEQSDEMYYQLIVSSFYFFLLYFTEFWFKILAYSWVYFWQHGVKTYFKSNWNILEFIIVLFSFTVVLVHAISVNHGKLFNELWYFDLVMNLLLAARITKLLYYLKLCTFCKKFAQAIIKCLSLEMEKSKSLAYELGKNYIAGEDEILENLELIVDNEKIRVKLREKTEEDRLAIMRRLGIAQKESPWVATTVKSRTAIRTVLNSIRDDIFELKVAGWVDDFEYNKLLSSLAERYKVITTIRSVEPSTPKLIFREVSYMGDNEDFLTFLYSNVSTRKFDPGATVFEEGEPVAGIFVLVTGMFKVTYLPNQESIEKKKEFGEMATVDYLTGKSIEEKMINYLIPGNTMGELATITDRPYEGVITAETHSEVYLLKRDIVKKGMVLDADPVSGFECRIWKSLAFRRAMTVMMQVPSYCTYTQEKIKYILERAFVPDLSNYKIFVVNDMMHDILLIEGIVVDFNTRELYIAPCYIPRAVQRLVLPRSSCLNIEVPVETKLMIIPAKDYNEYEIMITEEETCELVNENSNRCLHHFIQNKDATNAKLMKLKGMKGISRDLQKKISKVESNKSKIAFVTSKTSKTSKVSKATPLVRPVQKNKPVK